MPTRRNQCVAVSRLQPYPAAPLRRLCRSGLCQFVRHLDGLAEMRDRLLERGAAQRLVAGLAPPFDRRVRHARLREVVRQRFGLGGRGVGKAVA